MNPDVKYVIGYCFLCVVWTWMLDVLKTASKRLIQKTAKTANNLVGNKIAEKITKSQRQLQRIPNEDSKKKSTQITQTTSVPK